MFCIVSFESVPSNFNICNVFVKATRHQRLKYHKFSIFIFLQTTSSVGLMPSNMNLPILEHLWAATSPTLTEELDLIAVSEEGLHVVFQSHFTCCTIPSTLSCKPSMHQIFSLKTFELFSHLTGLHSGCSGFHSPFLHRNLDLK